MLSKDTLAADLQRLGLTRGDSLIVHASFKQIGEVDGGARAVLEALLDTIGPDGALLLPNLNIPGEFTSDNPPRFDVKCDPVRPFVGILPEVFKREYAEHFSLHPTHSLMGLGAKAPEILADHEKTGVPCGANTPWHKNASAGGRVLLLGVGQSCNTTYHCAEEQLVNSYQLSTDVIDGVVLLDGTEILVPSQLHVWGNHPDFGVVNDELEQLGHLRRGTIGNAPSLLLEARGFLNLCLQKMHANPRHFLK